MQVIPHPSGIPQSRGHEDGDIFELTLEGLDKVNATIVKDIIGGNLLGGNYWSELKDCEDKNLDGFYDVPHVIDDNNVDHLHLTKTKITDNIPLGYTTYIHRNGLR